MAYVRKFSLITRREVYGEETESPDLVCGVWQDTLPTTMSGRDLILSGQVDFPAHDWWCAVFDILSELDQVDEQTERLLALGFVRLYGGNGSCLIWVGTDPDEDNWPLFEAEPCAECGQPAISGDETTAWCHQHRP